MKERITISLDKDLLLWIDAQVQSKRFAHRSHALEYLMQQSNERTNNR